MLIQVSKKMESAPPKRLKSTSSKQLVVRSKGALGMLIQVSKKMECAPPKRLKRKNG